MFENTEIIYIVKGRRFLKNHIVKMIINNITYKYFYRNLIWVLSCLKEYVLNCNLNLNVWINHLYCFGILLYSLLQFHIVKMIVNNITYKQFYHNLLWVLSCVTESVLNCILNLNIWINHLVVLVFCYIVYFSLLDIYFNYFL